MKIPRQRLTAIIGRSGAGKSTLLRLLNNSIDHTGEIRYDQKNINDIATPQLRRRVIYVEQEPVIFPGSIAYNVCIGRKYWGMDCPDQYINTILDKVGLELDPDTVATSLSTGQKQRVHLARGLAVEPDVILLDEPTSALDAINKENFEKMVKKLVKEGLTIIMVTHDLQQTERIADYCVLFEDGQIILSGTNSVFFSNIENATDADILKDLIGGRR